MTITITRDPFVPAPGRRGPQLDLLLRHVRRQTRHGLGYQPDHTAQPAEAQVPRRTDHHLLVIHKPSSHGWGAFVFLAPDRSVPGVRVGRQPIGGTMNDITTQTPVEIDTALAAVLGKLGPAKDRAEREQKAVRRNADEVARRPDQAWRVRDLENAQKRLDAALALVDALSAEAEPFHAEFTRRGGWTRAFKVTNANGHIHRTTACATCFVTTSFAWLPQVSGMPEAEIVDMAASDACTVCYPTAPVDKPSRLFTADEVAAQAEREARAAAKAEREAKAIAKAITPVRVSSYETLRTITAARTWLTDAAMWGEGHPSFPPATVAEVAKAVAFKEGKTVEAVMAEAAKRAAKRR